MKVALWLALSHLLHESVTGFHLPQNVPHTGVWRRGSVSKLRPLFAEQPSKKSSNEESERPKGPVPPPTAPDMEALAEAFNSAEVDTRSDDYEPLRIPVKETKPKAQLSPEDAKLVVASGVGSAFIGLIVGSIIIFEFPDLDIVMEPVVWPFATAILFAAAGAVGGSLDSQVGEILRGTVGKAASSIGAGISSAVLAAIKAVIEAVQKKVKETTEEIKAIPSKVATAAKEKVEDAVEEIAQIPGKVKDAAIETAETVKQKTIEKAEEVVEEIKATPGRVVESSRKAVSDAVDDTLDAVEKVVEEVTAIPKKAVESVEETVNNLVGTKKPSTPQPPKIPPPPPMTEGIPEKPKTPPPMLDLPKPPVPKIEAPKFELPTVQPPKIDLPKLDVPKVSLPKLDPPKVVAAKPVEPAPAKAVESKKKDTTSEIMEIQMAVRKATEEARREALERSKTAEQNQAGSQAEKEAQLKKKKEEAKKADAAKKEAAIKAAEAKRQRELEIAQKQATAEEIKRNREQEIAKRNAEKEAAAEEARAKLEALKKKQAKAAEQSLQSAAPRRTISLGDLFNLGKNEDEKVSPAKPVTPTTAQAPPGVPTISNWRQNNDGSITGTITGSSSFKQGETITTSPVAKGATTGIVVKTNSGSRYFLGRQGGFSFAIPTPKLDAPKVEIPKADKPKSVSPSVDKSAERKAAQAAAEDRRKAAEELKAKQAALAEERRKAAEEKKAAQAAEEDKRRKAAEELKAKQAALAEERRKAAEEKKAAQLAGEEKRRKAAEELKAKQEALAAERQKAAEERKAAQAAAEEKRREELRKAAEAAKATQGRTSSEKRPTVSLANLASTTTSAAPKAVKPPRGVPEIRAWRKRPDGGIAGRIYGSSNFADGDFVETSPISNGSIENGSVVSTASGSRYFLSAEPAVKKANIAAAVKDMQGAKPGATITLTRQRKEREAAAAIEAVKSGKPRATFSLFGLGFGAADEGLPKPEAPRPSRPIPPKQAPRGVPTMSRWKKNFDGSITGLISGSKTFSDGDRVTTSPIVGGKIARGEVVTTGSGSKYFLS